MEWLWITGWWTGLALATLFLSRWLHRVINKISRPRDKLRSGILQDLTPTLNDAKFHIIAVPGLGAHPDHTWEAPTSSEPKTAEYQTTKPAKVHLLKDLLPGAFPDARIWTFVHDSTWLIDAPVKTTEEIGACLIKEVKEKQKISRLPIIFIGHSLGDIIIKQALCRSEAQDVINHTAGVVFLGAPHQGSAASAAGALLASLTGILGSDTTLLLSLKTHDTGLSNLAASFDSCVASSDRRPRKVPVISFYETKKTYLLGISLGVVVPRDSATVHADANESHSIETDHSGLNKCSGTSDALFKQLRKAILRLKVPSLLEQADAWIRYRQYTPERLRIERLSGESLAMDQCYVNLAIIEQHDQGTDKSRKQATTSSPFPLFARQNIDTPSETMQVELPTVFNEREGSNGLLMRPTRIFIRGRAGVGKSTLCKKIVSEFTKGTWGQWNELFDRVLWVPLRNLKLPERHNRPKYTFEDLLSHEFSLPTNGQNLARELSGILETENSKTLFLLDGLDEVSQDLTDDSGMHRFLATLLNQPNVIITSRPSTRPPPNLDLELETIGFSLDQVHEYIEKSFTNSTTGEKERAKIDKVKSFLEERWLIQELKKDIVRLGKANQGYTEDAHTAEIEDRIAAEIELVECLAFNGLHNDIVDFTPLHRASMVKLWPAQKLSLDETLSRLSFFRTSDTKQRAKYRNYHFIHLTYQEYFAAQYFALDWISAIEGKPVDLIGLTHQRLVMYCLSEISSNFPGRAALEAQLAQWLSFECRFYNASSLASEVEFPERALKAALLYKAGQNQALILKSLSKRSFISPNILEHVAAQLDNSDIDVAKAARKLLVERPVLPDEVLTALARRLNDEDPTVRAAAVLMLGSRSTVPDMMLATLAELLTHENGSVRANALKVLGNKLALPDEVLAAVAGRLDDEDCCMRKAAVEALGRRPTLPENLLMAVAGRLSDENQDVQITTIATLSGSSVLPKAVLVAMARKINDKDLRVGIAAIKAFQGWPILPDEVLVAVVGGLKSKDWGAAEAAKKLLGRESALPNEVLVAGWLDKSRTIQKAAMIALVERSTLSSEVLAAVARRLDDTHATIRRAAVRVFGKGLVLSEEVLAAITRRLDDIDKTVRTATVEVLGGRPALPERTLEAVVRRLCDKASAVRQAAIVVLGGRPILSDEILSAIISQLDSTDSTIREAAVVVLGKRPALPDKVQVVLARRLDDDDFGVQMATVRALGSRSELSDEILAAIARRLDDKSATLREVALEVLGKRPVLPDSVLASMRRLLNDKSSRTHTRVATIRGLGGRPALPAKVLAEVAQLLDDEKPSVRIAVLYAFGERLILSDMVLVAIASRLYDKDWFVRQLAVSFLNKRSVLPDEALVVVAQALEDECQIMREKAVKIIGSRSPLPDEVLTALGRRFNDENRFVRDTAISAFMRNHDRVYRKRHLVVLLYKALLIRSFQEHTSWYIKDGTTFIDTPEGISKFAIDAHQHEVVEWINEARPAWCPYTSS
ncbi:hypothetical protein NLG97_g6181 [Lecanicillium saksenae]|uniref:Uncharacterized protein n=1 Tax=Lecanicillium saksenae TaxID=468837 RepID=A0ACC1QQC8_9HYPO|nr:hypothetical protein NLG97_g6181 [Lecanicillium saksenae]